MNLLIIYTHPNHDSLNYSFLQQVLKGIHSNSKSIQVKTQDLYKNNFDPALVFNKDKRRRDLKNDPELVDYREDILWADELVFIYPIWWGRPPAMLMGYFDRIFAAGFAYNNKANSPIAEGLLKGKSITCISTMKGPTNYPLFFLNNAHKALMKKAIFNFVGIKKIKFFEFGNVEKKQGKQGSYLNKIEKYFEFI